MDEKGSEMALEQATHPVESVGDDKIDRTLIKSYLRKVDLHLLPLSFALYFLSVIDRNNIGNAKVAGMDTHLGLHGNQFNWIVSAFFFTYIFCEVPSNIMLKKFGARIWLPFLAICWSILVACLAAAKSYASLIVVRVLLGIFEAGYVPGFIYMTSFWYTKRQQAPRIALFFSAGVFAGIWAGPLAARLEQINGKLMGYQYIFIIEAAMTVGVAILMLLFLQNYPQTARFLTEKEREVALRMLEADRALSPKANYSTRQVLKALSDWTVWAYAIIFWAAATGGATQAIFGPTLISSMGYKATRAQVLSAVPSACGFVSQIISMALPRIYPRFSIWIMLFSACACVFYAIIATVENDHVRFTFLCLSNFALSPNMPLVSVWMSHNVLGVTKKGVASACTVMLGGIAGLIGSHIYRDQDAPQFRFGHIFVSVCNAVIFLIAFALNIYFRLENRRRDRNNEDLDAQTLTSEQIEDLCDNRPDHRYTW
ncbi:hypothetical protein LPJ78_005204 [Coemansia sp. RSA 989]|nr:major facilitator superfamily domain-containing protein [Coemansia mojavensis]KAJ1739147.1 hypothetical protein LPJ68_004938 [Coemansia sp. RSA 1086]KAJ1861655.1 hypothetical protein LPJ78_005204 [Coemansia sp. RSA 989]KAJ1869598.1 hypothetical protein LPJ55_005256 [Coemansia sp. RSA 990]KAJ2649564.1 hypothetical protein IWW40_003064 [Coemansia sp. RSA 1250]KAJ2667907.1 hypothetical protein IWW42_005605 [Coemansia sp. RSA 1085]